MKRDKRPKKYQGKTRTVLGRTAISLGPKKKRRSRSRRR